jgi:hypothetical protein
MRRIKRGSKAGSAVKAMELAVAVPQVMAIRTARMLAAGAKPGAADRAEFTRMGTEKVQALGESMMAMSAQVIRSNLEFSRAAALQWWRLWTTPWWVTAYRPLSQAMGSLPRAAGLVAGPTRRQHQRAVGKLVAAGLAPVHKRATANARRLGRIKKR